MKRIGEQGFQLHCSVNAHSPEDPFVACCCNNRGLHSRLLRLFPLHACEVGNCQVSPPSPVWGGKGATEKSLFSQGSLEVKGQGRVPPPGPPPGCPACPQGTESTERREESCCSNAGSCLEAASERACGWRCLSSRS